MVRLSAIMGYDAILKFIMETSRYFKYWLPEIIISFSIKKLDPSDGYFVPMALFHYQERSIETILKVNKSSISLIKEQR